MTVFADLTTKLNTLPDDMVRNRAQLLTDTVEALLTFRHVHHHEAVTIETVRAILPLEKLYGAYKASLSVTNESDSAYLSDEVKTKLLSYLNSIHGFDPNKNLEQQDPVVQESYGFTYMMLVKLLDDQMTQP